MFKTCALKVLPAFTLGMFMLLLLPAAVYSGVPQTINYQGRLTDDSGVPLDGDYNMVFTLYTTPTGETGQWYSGIRVVTVSNGLFEYTLGSNNSFLDNLFRDYGDLWLGIRVNGEDIEPRTKLSSVPYALQVGSIDGTNGGEIDGPVTSFHDGRYWYMVPEGAIIMWSGTLGEIPDGWALCNGSNGTPDLTDRFILSVGAAENPGASGGTLQHSHNIQGLSFSDQPSSMSVEVNLGSMYSVSRREHTHFHDIPPFSTYDESVLPPYYKLAFIMKVHAGPPKE